MLRGVARSIVLLSLMCLTAASAQTRSDSAGWTPAKAFALNLSSLEVIPADRARELLASATAQQRALDPVEAEFEVSYYDDPAFVNPQVRPALLYDVAGETIHGTTRWYRNGVLHRVDQHFDLPRFIIRGSFLDRIVVDDGRQQLEFFPDYKQAVLQKSARFLQKSARFLQKSARFLMITQTPEDWLRPWGRLDFDELAQEGRPCRAYALSSDGESLIEFEPYGDGVSVYAVVSALTDHAVTAWWTTARSFCSISYERSDAGMPLPVLADRVQVAPGTVDKVVSRYTLKTSWMRLRAPDPSMFRPALSAGTTVSDYANAPTRTRPRMFTATESGELVLMPSDLVARPIAANMSLTMLGGLGAVVIAVLGVRLYRTFRV